MKNFEGKYVVALYGADYPETEYFTSWAQGSSQPYPNTTTNIEEAQLMTIEEAKEVHSKILSVFNYCTVFSLRPTFCLNEAIR